MLLWYQALQRMVDRIDEEIKQGNSDALLLTSLADWMGYSPGRVAQQFHALTGHTYRAYVRLRRLAFSAIALRDSHARVLDVALQYGFSSHEAFTRSFARAFGLTPEAYRRHPVALPLRTRITALDTHLAQTGGFDMKQTKGGIIIYAVTLPAHRFLHIKNYESNGYWDFWKRQEGIPGQDCDTICGLLDSVKKKLDGDDSALGQFSGQIMARLYEADDRAPEAYGVRMPAGWRGDIPPQMLCINVPEGMYMAFEHGPFEMTQAGSVSRKQQAAFDTFDFAHEGYALDEAPGRAYYFFHNTARFDKRLYPIKGL